MPIIRFSSSAGEFATGVPDVAASYMRHPEQFGYRFNPALTAQLNGETVSTLLERIRLAAEYIDGQRVEIATSIQGLFVCIEPTFGGGSTPWRGHA
ncbi:MAG: hypothetical protein PHO20_02560 [Candidatus Peribacteraceae bacterium]|nr:hypothetical protein [Candidatus Peribacteraceae bacterium]MDD5739626.1 hypothetical protein [Candidatus Peribacteraceae bacterium]